MRTLPAGLTDALLNHPIYAIAEFWDTDSNPIGSADALYYVLRKDELTVRIKPGLLNLAAVQKVRLTRGTWVAGVLTTISSSKLWVRNTINQVEYVQIEGHLFPRQFYSAAGDDTYENVLTAIASAFGYTSAFANPTADFWQYQFFPTGALLALHDARHLFNIIRQKYIIEARDEGGEEINWYSVPNASIGTGITVPGEFQYYDSITHFCRYIWKDDAQALNEEGLATSPPFNLGYLPTGAIPPHLDDDTPATFSLGTSRLVTPIDLRPQSGDRIAVDPANFTAVTTFWKVTEIFDPARKAGPQWATILENNQFFPNTEAGWLPDSVADAGQYAPLNTSQFDGELSPSDTNIQAAFNTLDDHLHLHQLATVYVSKAGDNANAGTAPTAPKLTIVSAINKAEALITAGEDNVMIEIMDAGTYAESFTLSRGLHLIGPAAIIQGAITMEADTICHIHHHYTTSNNQVAVDKVGATGLACYRSDVLDLRGTGGALTNCTGIRNVSNGSVIFALVGQMFVGTNGQGITDSAAGFGHIHFWTPDLYLAGNNAIGIAAQSASTNIIGYIDHILELSSAAPTGTIGIQITNAGAIVKATISEIIADTVYSITAGSLHIQCPRMSGAFTGSPVHEVSDHDMTFPALAVERIQDIVGAMVTGGTETGIAVTYDDTNARLDFVAEVTQTEFDDHSARHQASGADVILLDNLGSPEDNTDLDASASAHGLLPKLSNDVNDFLNGQGGWSVPVGYTMQGSAATYNPVDGQTTFWGATPSEPPDTTAAQHRVYIRRTSVLKSIRIYWHAWSVAGSNNDISWYIRVNDTTDYLVQTIGSTGAAKLPSATGLDISLAAGDYFEIKVVQPTWTTNPTGVHQSFTAYFETA
jgi:hypothetical protein